MCKVCFCCLLIISANCYGQTSSLTVADGIFAGRRTGDFTLLSPSQAVLDTATAIYVNVDGKFDRWRAVYADRKGDLGQCVGGSVDRIYFTRSVIAKPDDLHASVALECVSKDGVMQQITVLPDGAWFAFANGSTGFYYEHLSDVLHVTTDGGRSWQATRLALEGTSPGPKGSTSIERARWVSATEIAVDTGEDVVGCLELTPQGKINQRWAKKMKGELVFVSTEAGLWICGMDKTTTVVNIADGKLVAKYESSRLDQNTVVDGKRVYSLQGGAGVKVEEITPAGLNSAGVIPLAYAALVIPKDSTGALIAHSSGAIYGWTAKDNKLELVPLKIDNDVVRNALKPSPDEPTPEEERAMDQAAIGLPQDLQTSVVNEAQSHKDWTKKQKFIWETEQFKKHSSEKIPLDQLLDQGDMNSLPSTRP